jgi:hypothetical protein
VAGSGAPTRPATESGSSDERGRSAPGVDAGAVTSRLPVAGSSNGFAAGGSGAERDEAGPARRSRHGLAIDRAWQVGDFAPPTAPHGAGPTSNGRSTSPDPAARDDERDADPIGSPIGDLVLRSLRSTAAPSSPPAARGGRESAPRSASDALTRPSTPDATDQRTNGVAGRRRLADTADLPDETRDADSGSAEELRRGRRPADTASPAVRDGDSPDTGRGSTGPDKDDNDRPAPRRTATEELEARRAAAGRSDPSTVVADWLAAELADLQRIWERISEPAVAGAGLQPELPRGTQDCVVSIDIARDGRRQVGRRPAKLVRALAAALAEHLPAGSRTEQDEPCVLSVVLVGEDRLSAEEWMRRTLPELLDDDPGDLRAPGLQLRAAVRDAGAAGPQFVHDLGARGGPPAGADDTEDERPPLDRPVGRAARRRAEEELSRPGLPAGSGSVDRAVPGGAGHRREDGRSKRTAEPGSAADERDRSAPAAVPVRRRGRAAGSRRAVPDPGVPTDLISGGPSAARADPSADGAVGREDTTVDVPGRRRARSADPVAEPDATGPRSGRRRAGSAAERGPVSDADRDRSPATPAAGAAGSRSDRSSTAAGPTGDRPTRGRRDLDALDSYRSDRAGPGRFRADRFGPDRSGVAPDADSASTGEDRNGRTSARSDRSVPEPRASGRRDPDRAGSGGTGARRAGEDRAEAGPDALDPDAGAPGRAGPGRAGSGRRRRPVPDPLDPATSLEELRSEPPGGGGTHAGPDRAGGHRMSAGEISGDGDASDSDPHGSDQRRSGRRSSDRYETDLLGSDRDEPDPARSDRRGSHRNGSTRPAPEPLDEESYGTHGRESGTAAPGRQAGSGDRPRLGSGGADHSAPDRDDPDRRSSPRSRRGGTDRDGADAGRSGAEERSTRAGSTDAPNGRPRPSGKGRRRADRVRVEGGDPAGAGTDRPAQPRHAGADRSGRPGAGDGAAGSPSDSDPPPADGDGTGREQPGPARKRIDASTEGLGLADLLAGALAEYRGI